MEKDKKNKLIVLVSGIVVILLMVFGISFAIFRFGETSTNQELVLGDIWMKYTESNGISLENSLPGDEYTNYFEFTITGTNTYTKKDIFYDISLTHGDIPAGKTEDNRVEDKYLKFKLTEVNGNTETEIFTDKTYDDLTNKRVHVDTISKTTNSYSKNYRLYMVISEELTYGNSSDAILSTEEFGKIFGSIKVNVSGDFNEKEIQSDLSGAESIIENVVTYEVASASDFSGGLVAINGSEGNDYGLLYNENDASHTIREYRYSGLNVNNYAYFNCKDTDGTYTYGDDNYDYENNCEIWRIVGTFKNANDEWNLKLMRNTRLTSDELPATYVVAGTTYTIEYNTSGSAYWNNPDKLKSTNYNDWTTGGLQYFLNTTSDTNGTAGYYATLTSKTKELIDETYTYHLGNVYFYSTTEESYGAEIGIKECEFWITMNSNESSCNIWNGNQATWNGAIGLLYLSDYGYSALSGYWSGTKLYDYEGEAGNTSWMQQTANPVFRELFLSPSSMDTTTAIYLDSVAGNISVNKGYNGVRPVLNLKSSVKVLKGDGDVNSPYVVIAE